MKKSKLLSVLVFAMFVFLPIMATESSAAVPPLGSEPANLPSIPYIYNGTVQNITSSDWNIYIKDIYDNRTYVSYNWTNNVTQDLILFDLSYTGLNPYGQQMILALSSIGFPSLANFTSAFNKTKFDSSQVKGYTNIQALNGGAYPGFSWSVPKIKKPEFQYIFVASLVGIVAAVFVLYFVFNRKR